MSALTDRRRTGALIVLGAGLVATALAVHRVGDLAAGNRSYVALQGAMLALCGLAAMLLWQRARRRDVVIVLVVAVCARALLAFDPPTLSDDANRFVWDGRVQAAGINPYRYVPADARLRPLRDFEVFTRVNRPYTHTIYPPAAEFSFLAIHETAGDGTTPLKLSWLALEAVAVGLLLLLLARARRSAGRVVLYAWHPLAVVEIASSGHPDAALLALVIGTLLLWDARRRLAGGAALAAAALTKFVPLVLAPFMIRRLGWRFLAGFAAVAVLLYLPYVGAGPEALARSAGFYAGESFGSGPFRWLTGLGLPDDAVRAGLLAALGAGVAASAVWPPRDLVAACRTTALLLGGAVLASNNVQPWYLLWVLPFLCVAPVPALLWATSTVSLYYLTLIAHPVAHQGPLSAIVWGPTLALLAAEAIRWWWTAARAPAQAGERGSAPVRV